MNHGDAIATLGNDDSAADEHLKFIWKISSFSECPQKKGEWIESDVFDFSGATWNLLLYPRGCQEAGRIGSVLIFLHMTSFETRDFRVNYKLSLRDVQGNDRYTIEDESSFKILSSYRGGSTVKRNILMGIKKKELLPDDTLTVICELTTTYEIAHNLSTEELEDTEMINDPPQLASISPTTSDSSSGSKVSTGKTTRSDVTLRAGDREFHVHKNKLKEKCPLFLVRHHLEGDTNEEVDIPGIEESVLNDLLLYIYTSSITKQSISSAVKLYMAAKKYALPELKMMCVQAILKNMSVDSVCDVLLFAAWSKIKKLDNAAKAFMAKNIRVVLNSDKWYELSNKRPRIALSILRDILLANANLFQSSRAKSIPAVKLKL